MKALKILAIVLVSYIGLVVLVESLIGYFQPDMPEAVTIITTDSAGEKSHRVLAGFDLDDKLYVAANHWPRAWYTAAVESPAIEVSRNEIVAPYLAVALEGAELERLTEEYQLPFLIRFLTGFPPRRFLRLDPGLN